MDGTTITTIVTGILAILAVLIPGINSIIRTFRETRDAVTATQAEVAETKKTVETVTVGQNKKLDDITVLVDGRYSAVLNELATMKEMFAQATGVSTDQRLAEDARTEATAQEKRVSKIENHRKQDLLP